MSHRSRYGTNHVHRCTRGSRRRWRSAVARQRDQHSIVYCRCASAVFDSLSAQRIQRLLR
eukprot:3295738-Pleurochrysis_carterae.AAC.2